MNDSPLTYDIALCQLHSLLLQVCSWLPTRPSHYLPHAGSAPGTSTVIDDESSLFDFIARAALSEYGDVQRVLLAPSTKDSRDILLAISQLMTFEQHQQQQQQQQRTGQVSSSRLTYKELKALCHQVGWEHLTCVPYRC